MQMLGHLSWIIKLLLMLALPFSSLAMPGAGEDPQKGTYLEINGSKIYYEECGTGTGVVLLHDGLLHAVTWNEVWGELCKKYHVVRFDRRGYGRSDAPKSRISPTDDVFQVMKKVHLNRAIIAGNSSGGALAIAFALAHPEAVEALFLIGPVVQGMRSSDHFQERGDRNSKPLETDDNNAAAANWSNDIFIVGKGHDAARKVIYETLAKYPQNLKYDRDMEVIPESPALFHLAEIQVPTYILVGEYDIPDVHAHAGAIEAGIPLSEREVVKADGHLIQLEDPKGFLESFTSFADLQEKKTVNVPASVLSGYAGRYNVSSTIMAVLLENGQLKLQIPWRAALPLFAESESKFFAKLGKLNLTFIKDPSGKVTEMDVDDDGQIVKCPRQ